MNSVRSAGKKMASCHLQRKCSSPFFTTSLLLQHKQPTHVVCQVIRCTAWLIEQEHVLQHSEHSSHSSSCCGYAIDGSAGFADR